MMKIYLLTAIALILILLFPGMIVVQAKPNGGLKPGVGFSGPHLNLNIHGVPPGVDEFKNDSIVPGRHSTFVPISYPENITIEYAFSYQLNWTVLDCDATEDGYVSIILPEYMYLDLDGDGVEETKRQVSYYMVYLVGLGKPSDSNSYNISRTGIQ